MSRFGKGLHRSPPHKISHRLRADVHPDIAAAYAAGPKGSAQLTPCQRMNQGGSGTCHAHSAAASTWCAFNAKGKPLAFVPSPRLIASCTYADVRAANTPPGQPLPPLQDTGADLQDDATAMAKWGIAEIQAPTSDGRYSDVENDPPDNTFPEPDTTQLQKAATNLISGEYSITVDENAPRMVAACLDAGIPVWVGFFCDSAFENMGPNDVAPAPQENDPNGGGHAVYLSGYRTNAAGQIEARLENSWGSDFADNGACWVSEAFIKACWNLWPMTVVA